MLTNRQIVLPYVLPYLAYVGIASVPSGLLPVDVGYGLRIAVTAGILVWAWRWYIPLTGPRTVTGSVLWGAGAGVVGTALWVALLAPFVPDGASEAWQPLSFWLRFVAAGAVVPVFEELMMRGFAFRLALQWGQERGRGRRDALEATLDERSLEEVRPGEWSWVAVTVSTVAFTAGHAMAEWPAAVAYGLLMCALWVWRRDLVSCIAAHAATNVTLALFVLVTGKWQYW